MTEKHIGKAIGQISVVILLAVIFGLILQNLLAADSFADVTTTGNNTNETLSAVTNITNSTFAIISTDSGSVCSLTSIVNATGAEAITSGNYTFTATGCLIILENDSEYIGEDLNVTYGYSYTAADPGSAIDTSSMGTIFSAFIIALTALFAVGGTILGVLWLMQYIKPLLARNSGLNMT